MQSKGKKWEKNEKKIKEENKEMEKEIQKLRKKELELKTKNNKTINKINITNIIDKQPGEKK